MIENPREVKQISGKKVGEPEYTLSVNFLCGYDIRSTRYSTAEGTYHNILNAVLPALLALHNASIPLLGLS